MTRQMFARLAAAIFGTSNDRALKRYQSRVPAINALEPRLQALSDEALAGQTALPILALNDRDAIGVQQLGTADVIDDGESNAHALTVGILGCIDH